MAPKAVKRGSAKKPNNNNNKNNTAAAETEAGDNNWEDGLIKVQLEEELWQACVSMVVGRSPEEEELIQALTLAVQRPQRKLFSCLTWEGTLAKIHELGNPKAKKSNETPMFYEVTETAKVLLDAGEEIPCELMAKILKFQLLQIKSNDQQRREAEEEEKVSAASLSASKDKGGAKGSDKKGKAAPPTVEESQERKTKLRRRGDVETPTFTDDEPEDGPQHYILLLGFYQPHLIGLLDAMEVHVANVIKLCSEQTKASEGQPKQHSCGGNEQSSRTSSALDAENVHDNVQLAVLARKLDLFWSGLRPVLNSGPLDSKLHDVVQLSCTISNLLTPFQTEKPESVLKVGSQIFEDVANLIYKSLEWRRQHQHYQDHVKFINIPTVVVVDSQPAEVVPTSTPRSKKKPVREEEEAKLPPRSIDVDMGHYSSLLDQVPLGACSVPLILHCMLEQVVISTQQPLPTPSHISDTPTPFKRPSLDHQSVSYLLQTALPLITTEEERSRLISNLRPLLQNEDNKKLMEKFGIGKPQKCEQPLIIRHHDERALRLRDVNVVRGFDLAEVELSMMKHSPVWKLIESVAQQRKSNSCWMLLKQQLQYYCKDVNVSWPEVERLLHQSVFEAMPLSRLDEQGVLWKAVSTLEPAQQQTLTVIPWDNPLSYAKQQLQNMQTKAFLTEDPGNTEQFSGTSSIHLDLFEMQRCRLRSLFDWHYAEHHDATIFPQVLQLASEEYCCLDTFRGSHNNTLYIFCHNPVSPHRQSKEFWDAALYTDVKFRNYLEHVADTISNWTRKEELKREAIQMKNRSSAESPQDENEEEEEQKEEEEEEERTPEPVIRKGSLKAWLLEQERQKEEEMTKKSKKDIKSKGKQKEEEKSTPIKKGKALSGGKKGQPETAGSADKTPTEPTVTTASPADKELNLTEESSNGFTGYIMDGKLIHLSGHLQNLYPLDGGCITVEIISFVEGSTQMKVAVKKDGHSFYTHINQVVDPVKPLPQPQDKKPANPKEECEVSEPIEMKRVKQGSLSAVLDNGIRLSYSFYGPTGEYTVTSQETSSTHHSSGTDLSQTPSSSPPESQECEGQPPKSSSQFNSINVSLPNGLLLQFLQEDSQGVSSEEKGILVRQSFPGTHRQHIQDTSLSKELSRIVTGNGAVIRYMRDGSTEVLFADGSVSFSKDSGPVWVPDSEVQEETSHEKAKDKKEKSSDKEAEAEVQRGCWLTTTPSGNRICTVGTTHKHIPTSSLLTFKATDPITNEVMLCREDHVVSVQSPDGALIVEHADRTRITSLLQSKPPNATLHHLLHTGKQPDSVTLKSASQCACSCTGYVCVTPCMDSINENVHTQCGNAEEIKRSSAGNTCDKDGSLYACPELRACGHMCDEREGAESRVRKNDDQSVFTGAESGKMSVCESDKESMSTKERVVLVEKEGCATVVMYPERHTAHVFLADGSVISGNNQGEYQVFPSSVGLLQIQSDGKCVYSSDPLGTPSPSSDTLTNQPGSYIMSHTDKVACDITDSDGNHFQVMEDGQISVLNFSPAPSTFKHDEEEVEEEDREMARLHEKHREHCPRLFLVHKDGSGTELLSSHTVEELLYQAHSDPSTALLEELLPDTQDEFAITILKPSQRSVWSQRLLDKESPDITPPNLRNRSWHDFPRVEKKTPGPPFGTDIGCGLTLREQPPVSAAQHQSIKSCPKLLEMRELYQYRPFTTPLKNTIDSRVKEYIESLMETEQRSEEMKVKDPRTEEESAHVSDLLSVFTSLAEKDDASHTLQKRTTEDLANLYRQRVQATTEQLEVSEDSTTAMSDSLERFECVTNAKDSKWTKRLAENRQEICEEKRYIEALKKKDVGPFFHPENIVLYQRLLQTQIPDMRSLSMNLPPFPKSDSPESFLKDAPQECTSRPLNPTPSQSTSHAAGRGRTPEKRPTNPTPQTAGESSLKGSARPYKSVQVDVTGKPRKTKVRLPTSILGSKPSYIPNQQFLTVEEPVRRKCRTISLNDPTTVLWGFQLLPSSVDFGTVKEGTSSAITVVMRNVGVDTCRFYVKRPPPETGLRIVYKPGPVPAGLHVELDVQICAAQVGEAEKSIFYDVVIHTEREILYMPVTANILGRPKQIL